MCLNRIGCGSIGGGLNPKLRLFLLLCLCLVLYVVILSTESLRDTWTRFRSADHNHYHHQTGHAVNRAGRLMFFHLPSLDDYKLTEDYLELKPPGHYCLKNGTVSHNTSCVCKPNYSGKDCSIPLVVKDVLKKNPNVKVARLDRPRHILMSLIWLSYQRKNETVTKTSLDEFYQILDRLAPLVDFLVIHEIMFPEQKLNADLTLNNHFENGRFQKFKPFTMLIHNMIGPDEKHDLTKIEFGLMKKSWFIFSTQVLEYRPHDLWIFMSANQFPVPELMLFLKYHSGLYDVVHLNPVRHFTYYKTNKSICCDISRPLTKPNAGSDIRTHIQLIQLKNSIISFQYASLLCQFWFDSFVNDYCLSDESLLGHFERNFWPIRLVDVGSTAINSTIVVR